jgi:hypothetical protein
MLLLFLLLSLSKKCICTLVIIFKEATLFWNYRNAIEGSDGLVHDNLETPN